MRCSAFAQGAYPDRPVRVIVAFPPGGTTDIVGRLVAQKVGVLWGGKTIVVENKAGASGTIGTGESIAAPADGYTLTIGNSQTHGTNQTLFPKLPYDLVKDVTPIAMLARTKNVLVVAGTSPYKSVDDLLKAGKTKPLSYASVGNGASSHIIGEFISRRYNLNAVHVPYKGGTPAITDLMGGQVDFMAATYGTVANLAKEGRVRILAVSDDKRDSAHAERADVRGSWDCRRSASTRRSGSTVRRICRDRSSRSGATPSDRWRRCPTSRRRSRTRASTSGTSLRARWPTTTGRKCRASAGSSRKRTSR